MLLVIALIAVALALVVSVIALLKSQKALKKSRKGRIESIAKKEIESYMQLNFNQKIKNCVHEELVRQQHKQDGSKEEKVKSAEQTATESTTDRNQVETSSDQGAETTKASVEISLPEPVTLYTGICKGGAFKHVTTAPDDKTVYTIYADSKDAVHGILNVDTNAYDKITQTPDYLQNACVYSGNGTQLKVTKTGTVIKESGVWVVKEPIEAEFN